MLPDIDFSKCYQSEEAKIRDAAYQLLIKGFMHEGHDASLTLSERVSVQDEYKFIKRFFNPIWCFYIFLIRILTLRNPIVEIRGILSVFSVKRVPLFSDVPGVSLKKKAETSELVSVVLPTLNRYSYLREILCDLEKQTYKAFEVIVIDQSSPFDNHFYNSFDLTLKIIHQPVPGLWTARNAGVRKAKGKYVAFTEDDVRVNPDWIEQHLKCIGHHDCDISAGVFFLQNISLPKHKSFFRWAEQFASGNALVNRNVFDKVGMFDLQFEKMRMGDGEFGLRCYLNGVKSVSNPLAYCLDIKAVEGGLRQMGSWDSFRPTSLFAARPIPSVLYFTRKYYGSKLAILDLLIKVPSSIMPIQFKSRPIILLLASIFSILVSPLIILQVVSSWMQSSKMMAEGDKIEYLN